MGWETEHYVLGAFGVAFFKMTCSSKTSGRGAKLIEIWKGGGGLLVKDIWDAFDLLVFEIILGSFSALTIQPLR